MCRLQVPLIRINQPKHLYFMDCLRIEVLLAINPDLFINFIQLQLEDNY